MNIKLRNISNIIVQLPERKAKELKDNYEKHSRGRGVASGDRRSNELHESLRREHPNPNTMEIKPRYVIWPIRLKSRNFNCYSLPIFVRSSFNLLILISRFGKGHGKRPGDGLINNRLQELAGSQRSPKIKEERNRSKSPKASSRMEHSTYTRRRSRSRDRHERRRSRERSPREVSSRRYSSDYSRPHSPPAMSRKQRSPSGSSSPQIIEQSISGR